MQEAWLDPSKLATPARPGGFLPRTGLVARAGAAPLVAIEAGPGAGKTLALLALAEAAQAQGAHVVWYGLDELDADPATFFHYMVAGVRQHIPQFGRELLALLAGEAPPARLLWQRFAQALAAFNAGGWLFVLDDAHHLDPVPDLGRALAQAAERFPAGLRVALATRTRPPFATKPLAARGLVALIDQAAVAFDAAEAEAFMRGRAPGGVVPAAWREAAATLEGWPLGLDLLTRTGAAPQLDGYVAEELFRSQPLPRRAFMVRAALLADLRADTCFEVLATPDAADELEALADAHLLFRLGDGAFRFPAYLRDYLLAEVPARVPADELVVVHSRAAAHFLARSRPEAALPHLLAAADWPAAVDAAVRAFPALAASGRHAQIDRWLAAFPPEAAAAAPWLGLWTGIQAARAGRREEAHAAYEAAREAFSAAGDAAGELKALLRLINLGLYEGDRARFGPAFVRALALAPLGRPEDQADLLLARTQAADQAGDLQLAAECAEGVLAIPIDGEVEVASGHVVALMNLYTLALHRGDLGGAHAWAAATVAVSEAWGFEPYRVFATFLVAHLHLVEGDTAAAGRLIDALPPGWEAWLDWIHLASAHYLLGHYHQARGDFKAAADALGRAIAGFERGGFREGRKLPLERRMWLAIQRGRPEQALEARAEAGDDGAGSLYQLALDVPLVRARHLAGDPAAALAGWAVARPQLAELGAAYHLARGDFYEAAARLATGDRAGAAGALERARAAGYEFLERQDQRLWDELAALAAPTRLLPAPPSAPSPVPGEGATSLSPRERVPGRAGEGSPLTLSLLGGFEVARGGVVLDQWPRRKAKLVLAALALNKRGLHVQDLVELLDGEGAGKGAVAAMHSNVMVLRKGLEPDLARGPDSAYVRAEQDRYVLAWDRVEAFDVQAFEAALAAARRAPAAPAWDAAVAIYRGHLLEERFFLDHFVAEREGLRRSAVEACLAQAEALRPDPPAALRALARAAALAPTDEAIYVAMMEAHKARGSTEHVRQAYWDCRQALKRHLGLAPSPEFEATYKRIAGA